MTMVGTVAFVSSSRLFALLTPIGRSREHDIFAAEIWWHVQESTCLSSARPSSSRLLRMAMGRSRPCAYVLRPPLKKIRYENSEAFGGGGAEAPPTFSDGSRRRRHCGAASVRHVDGQLSSLRASAPWHENMCAALGWRCAGGVGGRPPPPAPVSEPA